MAGGQKIGGATDAAEDHHTIVIVGEPVVPASARSGELERLDDEGRPDRGGSLIRSGRSLRGGAVSGEHLSGLPDAARDPERGGTGVDEVHGQVDEFGGELAILGGEFAILGGNRATSRPGEPP